MQTIGASVERLDDDQRLLTEAMRPTARELVVARRQLHVKAIVIAAAAIGSYWSLVMVPSPILLKLASAIVMIVALIAAATCVFHDANHASFSTSRTVNRLACYTGDLLGASSWIWRFKHNNLHHGNTNMVGIDADINQSTSRFTATPPRGRPSSRTLVAEGQGCPSLSCRAFANVPSPGTDRAGHVRIAEWGLSAR